MYTGQFNFAKSVFFYFVYYTWAVVLRSEPEPVLNSPAPAPAKKDRLRLRNTASTGIQGNFTLENVCMTVGYGQCWKAGANWNWSLLARARTRASDFWTGSGSFTKAADHV